MKCPNCNKDVKEEANFCSRCGTKLKEKCRCWVKKKDNYDCGESSCPGYGIYGLEKQMLVDDGISVKKEETTENNQRVINIMGVKFLISEVEVVNKERPRKGEINFLTNEITIDRTMPKDLRNQVVMHEVLHAIFDLLGLYELGEDEEKVQGIATALHQVFTSQTIFS